MPRLHRPGRGDVTMTNWAALMDRRKAWTLGSRAKPFAEAAAYDEVCSARRTPYAPAEPRGGGRIDGRKHASSTSARSACFAGRRAPPYDFAVNDDYI